VSFSSALWRVRLFDGPILQRGEEDEQARFRSKKVGALLAFLALRLGKRCTREEIAYALWPEEEDERVLSNRLRFTLSSLRKQLEPTGISFGTVLDASLPGCVRLREGVVWCDVSEFERAHREGRHAEAAMLLRGPLMPGFYDEWLRPEQVRFELLREDLGDAPTAPPEPRQATDTPSKGEQRLPLYLTRFFGRESELAEIPKSTANARLVTLTGPGGIGKTRLAVETAKRLDMPCAFVALAELNDPSRIGELALGALGISSRRDSPTLEQLAWVLSERPPMLLVLDNAEHLVGAVAEFALQILQAAPSLHLLVTSRQRLEVPGEAVIVIDPLGAPAATDDLDLLAAHPSVALFVDRAKNVRPDFALHSKIAEAVATICEELEGMPLAIELAAVRVTAQSPNQIAESLSASLIELKSRQRGLAERHRSLRAAVQGSYDLLEPDLKRFFCKLSVFEGGWSVVAAKVVTANESAETHLEELVIRSLVLVQTPGPGQPTRYAFLETLRQFAAENLSEPDLIDDRNRHAEYFLGLASQADENDVRTFWPLDAEQENLILAFLHGRNRQPPTFWRALAGALEHAFVRGRHRVALRWIDTFSPDFRTIPEPATRIRVQNAACQILPDVGRLADTQALAESMTADALAGGDGRGAVYADVIKGYVAEFSGGLDEALTLHCNALAAARELGDPRLLESCLAHASGTLHDVAVREPEGSTKRRDLLHESEALARELQAVTPSFSRRKPLAPLLLGTALKFQGRREEALLSYEESRRSALELGTTTERMFAYVFESEIPFELGNTQQAAQLFGAFQTLQERMGYSIERAQYIRPTWISNLDSSLQSSLGQAKYEFCLRAGAHAYESLTRG
jgi:predicted ATPase